ncbi:hypothetical protein IE81DRAFT_350591 [Ceraceosorus guamensis]|uniref:Uncharacterized protein n=1 Tax=Ceraceosorus guamensis TaxID=1522189 RepID=A0A316VMX2_9BASI|nr:hypothetical protein IE81DRAFT_350591 [Ceraceosorus guamensis]PWN38979.1 hypothetical protein IE81DRAFT_350591 [Ceraceosorus guamensis]
MAFWAVLSPAARAVLAPTVYQVLSAPDMSLDEQANRWDEECKKQIDDEAHVWTYYKKFVQNQAVWCICGSTA